MRQYLLHVLIAFSQLGNALLGGYPDESMSARAHRTGSKGRWPGVGTLHNASGSATDVSASITGALVRAA